MSHWYTTRGEKAYGAGIKEVRERGLLASVTTVMQTKAEPQLEKWKQGEVLKAALSGDQGGLAEPYQSLVSGLEAIFSDETHGESLRAAMIQHGALASYMGLLKKSREERMSDEDYAAYIMEMSQQEGSTAAQKGTAVHDAIEKYFETGITYFPVEVEGEWTITTIMEDSPYREVMLEVYAYLEQNYDLSTAKCEMTVIIPTMSLAGRIDLLIQHKNGEWVLLDFKTQNVKSGKYFRKYLKWIMQLAGYRESILNWMRIAGVMEKPKVKLVNLAISSNVERPIIKEYVYEDENKIYEGKVMLANCAENFYLEKNHTPPRIDGPCVILEDL